MPDPSRTNPRQNPPQPLTDPVVPPMRDPPDAPYHDPVKPPPSDPPDKAVHDPDPPPYKDPPGRAPATPSGGRAAIRVRGRGGISSGTGHLALMMHPFGGTHGEAARENRQARGRARKFGPRSTKAQAKARHASSIRIKRAYDRSRQ